MLNLKLFILIAFSLLLRSFPERAYQIPNGNVNSCLNCHVSLDWGSDLNDFGKDSKVNVAGGVVNWSELAKLDSDNDGFTNGEELQDPYGTYEMFGEQPGNKDLVTNPGDPDSFPSSVEELELSAFEVYPNPVSNQLNISFSLNKLGFYDIYILDALGKKMKNLFFGFVTQFNFQDSYRLDIPSGHYLLIIESDDKVSVKNIIIN